MSKPPFATSPWAPIACLAAALFVLACGKDEAAVCTTDTVVTQLPDTTVTTSPPEDTSATDTSEPADSTAPPTEVTTADTAPAADDGSVLPECPWVPWDEGLEGGRVDYVVFDPRVAGTVWATSGGALMRSLDGGITWSLSSTDIGPSKLAFPADDPKALLASATNGVWASSDSGRSFQSQALGGLEVQSLIVHPAAPQRVFVGTRGAGILRAHDGGKAFTPVNVGVPRIYVWAMAAPSDDPDVVLATGIQQNDSYGVGASGVILRSADGGSTWATVSTDLYWGYELSYCPSDSSRVLAASRRGALESRDGGLTWQRVPLLGQRDVVSIAWSAERCDVYWVSVYQQGVYRIDDDGLTLTGPMKDGLDIELVRFAGQLAGHPTDPQVVLAATHAGLYRSDDGGYRWRPVQVAKGLVVTDLEHSGERAWMTTWGNRLWTRTHDTPWEKEEAVPRDLMASIAVDRQRPDFVLVASGSDGWMTTSGPAGFALLPGVQNPRDAVVFDDPAEIVIATQVQGVLRSSEPTVAWTPSNEGLSPFPTSAGTFIDARMIVADPNQPDRVYVALNGRGVALSDDRGRTWTRPDNALTDQAVMRLAAAPMNGVTRLFALATGAGVWVSDDGGLTWATDNEGLSSLAIIDLAVDVVDGMAYVSESGGPIFASEDGLAWRPLDRWCLPEGGWGELMITERGTERWLVAATGGNRVIRHRL